MKRPGSSAISIAVYFFATPSRVPWTRTLAPGHEPSFLFAVSYLREFILSGERQQLEERLKPLLQVPAIEMRLDGVADYAQVISVGSHCATAGELKRFGLKRASYPFDWIFSNLSMAAHCIESDFEQFLDRRFHQHVPVEERLSTAGYHGHHTYYREHFGIEFVFNHRGASKDEDFAYYARGVDRFRAAVRGDAPVLLLALVTGPVSSEQFERLSAASDTYSQADLLILDIRPQQTFNTSIELIEKRGRDRMYRFETIGTLGAVSLDHPADEFILREFLRRLDRPAH